MSEWVSISLDESDEGIEIQSEDNGTLLLSSILAQFPHTTGLKFRHPESNKLRGIRISDGVLYPPSEEGWGECNYICVRPEVPGKKDERKRKTNYDQEMVSKNVKYEDSSKGTEPIDLVILGIPWKATEEELKEYFSQYGEVDMLDIKCKPNGESKGYGFVKFVCKEPEAKVLMIKHRILDRWCEVKIPESKSGGQKQDTRSSCKIFVGRMSESISKEDLKDHFENFGTVTDVYIPQPFRRFAFVQFSDSDVAHSLLGMEHDIKGHTVSIGSAVQKPHKDNKESGGGGGEFSGGANYGGGGGPGYSSGGAGYGRGGGGAGYGGGSYSKFVEMAARWALEGYGNPALGYGGGGGGSSGGPGGGAWMGGSGFSSGNSWDKYRGDRGGN